MNRWILLLALSLTSCHSPGSPTDSGLAHYSVTGTSGRVSVTFARYQQGTGRPLPLIESLPFNYYMTDVKPGDFLQIQAQILGPPANATITVSVWRHDALCQSVTVAGIGATGSAGCTY